MSHIASTPSTTPAAQESVTPAGDTAGGGVVRRSLSEERSDLLAAAPAPSLLCPPWCGLEAGHRWTDGEDGEVGRWHELDLSPDGRDGYAEVVLRRQDRLVVATGDEHVSGASRVVTESRGVGDGSGGLEPAEALGLASALFRAARLLKEARDAGDPRMGRSDEQWAAMVAAEAGPVGGAA